LPRPHATTLGREIRTIQMALAVISDSLGRLVPLLKATPATGQPPSKRKLRLSPARRATLKLQGQYMGHMRSLGPRQKARVKVLKAAKGFPAAIKLAKKLAHG
jgi:hypothetical protein